MNHNAPIPDALADAVYGRPADWSRAIELNRVMAKRGLYFSWAACLRPRPGRRSILDGFVCPNNPIRRKGENSLV
ncbi:MAG TPA: hypothetical protein VGR14_02815 [Verrucomicrobiae bacterium]|nr:hypothetical protein [Verrucomicrobiae bacterium]